MPYPPDDNGIVVCDPDIPPNRRDALYYRAYNYPSTYQAMASRLGVAVDCVLIDGYTTLKEANDARQAADDYAAAHPEIFAPQSPPIIGQVPVQILPIDGQTGYVYDYQQAGYDTKNEDSQYPALVYPYLAGKAHGLTGGAMKWQMYGILLALSVDKCLTYGAHGGRHAGLTKL